MLLMLQHLKLSEMLPRNALLQFLQAEQLFVKTMGCF